VDKLCGATFLSRMTPTLAILGELGGGEILAIGILALLMFGSKRLPELGRAFGRAMREFKRATSGVEENLREVMREDPLAPRLKPAPRQVSRGGVPVATTLPVATTVLPAAATLPPPPAEIAPAPDVANVAPPPSSTPPAPERNPGAEDEIAS
jgi:TatA/E family protein of Tat protein translocase